MPFNRFFSLPDTLPGLHALGRFRRENAEAWPLIRLFGILLACLLGLVVAHRLPWGAPGELAATPALYGLGLMAVSALYAISKNATSRMRKQRRKALCQILHRVYLRTGLRGSLAEAPKNEHLAGVSVLLPAQYQLHSIRPMVRFQNRDEYQACLGTAQLEKTMGNQAWWQPRKNRSLLWLEADWGSNTATDFALTRQNPQEGRQNLVRRGMPLPRGWKLRPLQGTSLANLQQEVPFLTCSGVENLEKHLPGLVGLMVRRGRLVVLAKKDRSLLGSFSLSGQLLGRRAYKTAAKQMLALGHFLNNACGEKPRAEQD